MTSVLFEDRLFEVEMGEAEAPKAAPAGEAKTFRRYDQSQCYLLPPSLDEILDEDEREQGRALSLRWWRTFLDLYGPSTPPTSPHRVPHPMSRA